MAASSTRTSAPAKKPAAAKPAATAKKTGSPKTATTKKPATKSAAAKPASKTAPAKKAAPRAAAKTPPAKKPAARPAAFALTPEQRYRMVQEAAYFLAERNGFAGRSEDYWTAAEAQIDAMLARRKAGKLH